MLISREKLKLAAIVFYALTMSASLSCAAPGPRGGPPPEAINACTDLSEGDTCSFTGRRDNTVEGTCIVPPNEEAPVCYPEGGPPSGHERPGR